MKNQFGKLSQVRVEASYREDKTVISDVAFTAPFKIMRPFYENEDYMTVMLLSASAGTMAGDRQQMDIHVREQAKMELISQAYEKIHPMEEGCARRNTHIVVEENACLHYTPLPVIPFSRSDYESTLHVELKNETSRFIFSEILTCGRVAHGERFQYRRYKNTVSVYQSGKIVYRDHTSYEPGWMDMSGFGMYEGYTHLANLLICNEPKSEEWMGTIRELIDADGDVEGGATRTAVGHIVVRILGKSGQKLEKMLEKIRE